MSGKTEGDYHDNDDNDDEGDDEDDDTRLSTTTERKVSSRCISESCFTSALCSIDLRSTPRRKVAR